jgi:rubrerythrin
MTTPAIDLARLSLQDALDLAILIEEEAQERYEELANQLEAHHTPQSAVFFRTMAGNEARHRSQLAERRARSFGNAPRTVGRAMLWDVEAPEYDEVRASMTRRQALEVALRAEQKAHAFFTAALPQLHDPHLKALFEELRDEEVKHQRMVQAELDRLPPDPPGSPTDYEDEPVAQ